MHKIKELKELLCKELEEFGGRTSLDRNALNDVDTLAHAIKNLDKILQGEEEYSMAGGSYRRSMRSYDGESNEGSYRMSGRRDSMGRYAREGASYARYRDGMGHYILNSAAGDEFADKLRDLMEDAPDDRTRNEIQKLISKVEKG